MNDINDAYKRLADEQGATVFSLYDAFTAYCENNQLALDSLLCDGLHPNNDGYRAMYGLIIEAFQL
jgi:lysophospholipase L1-like esterase